MDYQDSYYGYRFVVRTVRHPDGRWGFATRVLEPDEAEPIGGARDYDTEDEARRAGSSVAAASIDRLRSHRGKP